MPVIPIDDVDDPRIRVFRGLRDHQLRMFRERTDAELAPMCIVEGDRLIRRALGAGMEPLSLLRDPGRPEPIEAELPDDFPVYTVEADLAPKLVGMHIHRWAMACFRRPPERSFESVLADDPKSLLLTDRVVNPTNLGAMVRTAAGLGVGGLLLDPESCDPLYRRASRVSMGASFTFPWARVADIVATIGVLKSSGFGVVAIQLTSTAVDLHDVPPLRPVALVMGNEGYGVSEPVLEKADVVAQIPMHQGVDSLNVTAAAAVACWEITRHA